MDTETELEVNEKTRHEDKVVHLQMIQGVIDRMSTSAAIYKRICSNYCDRDSSDFLYRGERMDIIDCVPSSNLLSGDGYILSQIRKAVSDSVRKDTE